MVVCHEVDDTALYVGGDLHDRFVRIRVDLIARTLPDSEARARWTARVNAALTPFMEERSLSWEIHMGETSNELWSIQGLRPPPAGSAAEKRWVAFNAPVPYETTA